MTPDSPLHFPINKRIHGMDTWVSFPHKSRRFGAIYSSIAGFPTRLSHSSIREQNQQVLPASLKNKTQELSAFTISHTCELSVRTVLATQIYNELGAVKLE